MRAAYIILALLLVAAGVIAVPNDYWAGTFNPDGAVRAMYEWVEDIHGHIHTVQYIWPDEAQGTQLTGAAGAYAPGSTAVIIASSGVSNRHPTAEYFVLTSITVHDASASDDYQIDLYCAALGDDSLISQVAVERGAASGTISPVSITSPKLPSTAKVSGRIASSSVNDNAYVKLGYHIH
jgi:hypothetical protein